MKNIKNKFIESVKWNVISMIIKMVLQISFTIILTRLLSPDDFGLFAIGMMLIVFGNMLSDFGLGSALIQKKELTDEDIRFVFTLQIIFGFFLTITVYGISPFIAAFFNNIQAENIIAVLSSVFFIQSIGLTSASLLKRDLEFKTFQKIGLISHFISYVLIGLPMAYMSYGVWSLVLAQLAQISIRTVLLVNAKRHTVKPLLNNTERKYFLTFGSKNISINIVNWGINNISNIYIGRFLGTTMLGYFDRSLTLSRMPMDMITTSFQAVLFPFYSRLQDKKELYKITLFGASASLSLVLFPLFFTIALVPETIIYGVFGSKWMISAEIMTPLALTMPLNMLMALGGPILWGNNRGELEIKAQFNTLILMIVILYFVSQISLLAAVWGYFISYLFRLYFVNRYVLDYINASWMDFMRMVIRPILFGIAVAFPVFILDHKLTEQLMSPIIVLSFDFIFAAILWVSLFFTFIRHLIDKDLYWLVEKNQSKIPKFILKKLGLDNK